ncbi:serine/threonine protein phosphatase [Clostridia bacterium]|nr:serine/threonine protein phosphatase [Clostridia bacterium]
MTYVISDIHGRLGMFEAVLGKISLSPSDKIIINGDMIDRGEDSLGVVRLVRSLPNTTVLIGNHESMMIDFHKGRGMDWVSLRNGGRETIQQLSTLSDGEIAELLVYFGSLPYSVMLPEYNCMVIHAGISLNTTFENLTTYDYSQFVWIRNAFIKRKTNRGFVTIFGHTVTGLLHNDKSFGILLDEENEDKVCIDCGAAYADTHDTRLAALKLDDGHVFYSDEYIDKYGNNIGEFLRKKPTIVG